MGALRLFCLVLSVFWLSSGSAEAARRVALVLGNSAYKTVPRLINPVNDAVLVGGMFKNAGFDSVDIKTDLNAVDMRKALREFGGRARDADVAIIYYAGHGIELDGTNYLIPTDAALETDSDVLDETVALDRALFAVEPARQLRLVILDACRDNPFAKSMKRTVAARAIGRGLAKVEPTSPNTMIAFAAKAGSTASDGDWKNSPFAAALVERLPTPGLDLRKAFGFVRDDVLKNTGYRQEPYVYGSLGGDDVPLVPAKPAATSSHANPQDAVRRDYELALQIGTREVWTAFLAQYPDGFYASLAKGQLNRIDVEATRAAAEAKVLADAKLPEKRPTDKPLAATSQGDIAALTPPQSQSAPTQQDVTKLVQVELRRVGCLTEAADDDWTEISQRSLSTFNKFAGTKLDPKLASLDALEAIRARPGRVCPPVCGRGFRPVGEQCVKLTCQRGQTLNEDGECTARGQDDAPARKPDRPLASKPETPNSKSTEQRPARGGQCSSISQRCAVEIGGKCNPATGAWVYGRDGAGGNTQAFNNCVGRMLAGRKQ